MNPESPVKMIRFSIVLALLSALLRLPAAHAQTPETQTPGGCEELPALTAKLVSYKTTLLDWPRNTGCSC